MGRANVEELLRERIGLDPKSVGLSLLRRAERSRMQSLGMVDFPITEYHERLSRSESEVQALIEEVVISESWFFRDEHPFQLLGQLASEFIKNSSGTPFRALSIPCAGGEEPYSMAMALVERGIPKERILIDAVDVSERVLESAKRAIYTSNSFRTVDLSFRDRYFHKREGRFELNDEIRRLVRFHHGNILGPDLLEGQDAYQAVFCKNLLIYFDEMARQKAVETLDRLLTVDGTLFVGHAEHAGLLGTKFRTTQDLGSFAYSRRKTLVSTVEPGKASLSGTKTKEKPIPLSGKKSPAADSSRLPVRSPVSSNEGVTTSPAQLAKPSVLKLASDHADAGRYGEASALCEDELRTRGPCPQTFYLLGMIRQATGRRDDAEAFFLKTVYLDPTHAEALLSLASIAQRKGDVAAALNYRKRAHRVSEGNSHQ